MIVVDVRKSDCAVSCGAFAIVALKNIKKLSLMDNFYYVFTQNSTQC